MDTILEMLNRGVEQLLGRAGGPLHFRLFVMPLVVAFLAVRAHQRDVREGQPVFLWAFLRNPAERRRLFHSGLKAFGRVFIIACVLDTTYQVLVFRTFYPVQMLIIAVTCAIVPYFLIRGPVLRIASWLHRKWSGPERPPTAHQEATEKPRPDSPPNTDH